MQTRTVHLLICGVMLVFMASGFSASAQEPTKEAKVEQILALSKTDAMIEQMFNQVRAMTTSELPKGTTAEVRAKAEEIQGRVMELLKSRMSWERMRPQYIKIYSDTFSESEIDGLLTFYQSPAGRAMLEKMPIVMSKSIALSQTVMSEILPEVQRISKEAMQK